MKKILLIATFFVAAYAVNAQSNNQIVCSPYTGQGSPVPTPGTHVNADDITFSTISVENGQSGHYHVAIQVDGTFVGLGSSNKASTNTYLVDATLSIDRDCGLNPGEHVAYGLNRTKTKAISVGSGINRNGRMPWSAIVDVNGNTFTCPPPFDLKWYAMYITIETDNSNGHGNGSGGADKGFLVNGCSVPLK